MLQCLDLMKQEWRILQGPAEKLVDQDAVMECDQMKFIFLHNPLLQSTHFFQQYLDLIGQKMLSTADHQMTFSANQLFSLPSHF